MCWPGFTGIQAELLLPKNAQISFRSFSCNYEICILSIYQVSEWYCHYWLYAMGKAKKDFRVHLGVVCTMHFFSILQDNNIWFGFVCLPHRRPILWPHVYIFIPANDSTVGRDGMLPLRAPLTPSWWRDPDAVTSVTTEYTTQLRSLVFCLFSLMTSGYQTS